jgi:hypothetical protein
MSNQINHNLVKFRPVLTLQQITHIIELCQIDQAGSDDSKSMSHSIVKVLVPMKSKVEVGAINPAYKLSETHIQKQFEKSERERYESNLMSASEEAEYEAKIMGI